MDKIKIEKVGEDKYILYFANEEEVSGYYLTRMQLQQLQSDLTQVLEYKVKESGQNL
jgi:hypothetical protein